MDTHGMAPRMCLLPHSTDVLKTCTSKVLPALCSLQPWRAQKPGDAEALLGNTADAETSRRAGGWGRGNGSFSRHGDGRGTTASVRGKMRGPWS